MFQFEKNVVVNESARKYKNIKISLSLKSTLNKYVGALFMYLDLDFDPDSKCEDVHAEEDDGPGDVLSGHRAGNRVGAGSRRLRCAASLHGRRRDSSGSSHGSNIKKQNFFRRFLHLALFYSIINFI